MTPEAQFRLRLLGSGEQAARRLRARLSATALLLTAMLLVPTSALAQIPTQVVEYYHTDVLGSVRAVTKQVNGEWQVVARHDFRPFGEEVAAPTPPQDKRLFTGKERDSETGLDYFEARYLRAALGRFTTIDPEDGTARLPQSWNRYAYAFNNPVKFVDPDGRWPTYTHNSMIATAFPGLSSNEQVILMKASRDTDFVDRENGAGPQEPVNAYLHGMRDGSTNQSVAEAQAAMFKFVEKNEGLAREAQKSWEEKGRNGLSPDALRYFGKAMHPVMDENSPAHVGFQPWFGNETKAQKAGHFRREPWATNEQLGDAARKMREHLARVFGASYLKSALAVRQVDVLIPIVDK